MALVLLAVDGEEQLAVWQSLLNTAYKSHFCEPYWNDRLTAVVAFGDQIEKQLEGLKLL